MSHSAFPRGQGPAFADLPPTLQPCAIAASAPPSDHLRVAAFSGLIYFGLLAAGAALSSLAAPPLRMPAPPAEPGPTVVYEPRNAIRIPLPPAPTTKVGGGGAESAAPSRAPAPAGEPAEAPAGLPTEDHHRDGPATGAGTPGPGAPPGAEAGPGTGTGILDVTAMGLAVLRQVDPVYPELARRARIQGQVVLMMTVDETGQPVQVQVLGGHPVFHEAARQAARQWRFEPARMNGRPVMAAFRLTLKFSLR